MADIFIVSGIAFISVIVLFFLRKQKKEGKGCCGIGCSGCKGNCTSKK